MSFALKTFILALSLSALGITQQDTGRKRVLILCTGNSARSQMAAGFLGSLDPHLAVYSAGTAPAARVNPYAVRAMGEVGIDISKRTPKSVQQFINQPFD